MPPRFLLAGLAGTGRPVEVVDLSVPDGASGRPPPTLSSAVAAASGRDALVVAPASVHADVGGDGLQLQEVFRVGPHLSMEDAPRSLTELALVAYSVKSVPPEDREEDEEKEEARQDEDDGGGTEERTEL
jgi:hypothetical protein